MTNPSLRFSRTSRTVNSYIKEVKDLLETRRKQADEIRQNLNDGVYRTANDPRDPMVAPLPQEIPPFLNFAPLDNAAVALSRAADRYHTAVAGKSQQIGLAN